MKYYIKTFGCQANTADSERVAASYEARGFTLAPSIKEADHIIINTCMVRQSAENRVYGLVNNLASWKGQNPEHKIIVTGCLVGLISRDATGKVIKLMKGRMPFADAFLPTAEVGFEHLPIRTDKRHAWVPISNGCNNFCTYCVVPFTRGHEISRPYEEIISECKQLKEQGYLEVTLLGQNVNSYGADLVRRNLLSCHSETASEADEESRPEAVKDYASLDSSLYAQNDYVTDKVEIAGKVIEPVMVKHLGKYRIPTLFPYLLEEVAKMGFAQVNFISSNPWDFSGELIEVIAGNENINREIHLPVQSGDDTVLKRMNRWYSRDQYLQLVADLKSKIDNLKLSTDVIVGFPGETEAQFMNTVALCKQAGFEKAYVAMYSDRPATTAHKSLKDDVPFVEKKRRWQVLEDMINKPHLAKKYIKS